MFIRGVCKMRRSFDFRSTASASSENSGATMISTNSRCPLVGCFVPRTAFASASSTGRLNAMIPPNAEIGSAANACPNASARSSRLAMPHGVMCLTITAVGSYQGVTHVTKAVVIPKTTTYIRKIASLDKIELKDNALIDSWNSSLGHYATTKGSAAGTRAG